MISQRENLLRDAVERGQYAKLYHKLRSLPGNEWSVSFTEIEQLLGFTLPNSARLYRPWWANDVKGGHTQALAWDVAGWQTSRVNLVDETLIFVRTGQGSFASAMNIDDQTIVSVREKVDAAREELDMAVTFHEAWKPSAYDEDLHKRMGASYATNTFLVVRTALYREMLLALMRLWDKDTRAIGMESIAATIGDPHLIDALAADRAARIGLPEAEGEVRKELSQCASVLTHSEDS
jgi:hypothetical protein